MLQFLQSIPMRAAATAWRRGYLAFATALILGCGGRAADYLPHTAEAPLDTGEVSVTVNTASTFPISRFIYGGNFIENEKAYGGAHPPVQMTLNRMGGNRLTAYNWENNFSNAGGDYEFHNDQYLSESTSPGAGVRSRAVPTFEHNQAFMATIPMLGYVSSDACGCNVGNTDAGRAERLATHFRISRAVKGSPLGRPTTSDNYVYQDEFVQWFDTSFPGRGNHPTAPVFFSLDNEPDLWHTTHKELQSDNGDDKTKPRIQTYTGFSDTSVEYAAAVKAVMPAALIFGPATATYTGIETGGRYPYADPVYGKQNFIDVYLDRMRAAESTRGKRLLDVLDIHFYPEVGTSKGKITNDFAAQDSEMIARRLQAPRSLWDPTYDEGSWVSGNTKGPIALIPRLKKQIAEHYPGTRLSISEYAYGRGGDISGGIAQADVLGIFGREGVFAAALWPLVNVWAEPYKGDGRRAYAYVFGAFRMFRNYDDNGGAFGDTGLEVSNSDNVYTSAYASRDSAGRTVLVMLNKTEKPRRARITLRGMRSTAGVGVYTLTADSLSPVHRPDLPATTAGAFQYVMPPMSVSTLVVKP